MKIVLASNSPRRKEILSSLGIKFDVLTVNKAETYHSTTPGEIVEELAFCKGNNVKEHFCLSDELIISCDTLVYADGKILGKPKDKLEARKMITSLQNSTHSVYSGISIIHDKQVVTDYCKTDVSFSKMSEEEIEFYISTNEPYDKAGGYGIQGFASMFIKKIDGDYFNVVGFPVRTFYEMMKKVNLDYLITK